jgi:hypothetical protein
VQGVHSDLDAVIALIFVPKLRSNKRSAYIERQTSPSSKRRPHFETRTGLGGKYEKPVAMDREETEAMKDYDGEGQQQFNRPTGPWL